MTAATATAPNYGGMALTAIGGLSKAYGTYQAGQYSRKVANVNARLANQRAEEAIQAGELAANRVQSRVDRLAGSRRAASAAGNVLVGSGTARSAETADRAAASMDELMLELNARREAYGHRLRAVGDIAQGRMSEKAAEQEAIGTLLDTGRKEWMLADRTHQRRLDFGEP